ncbi:hypothetical protein CC86DRAFT_290712 [Ophiobolus disseminans]|uniref:endo-1,3(4)-beta-glucanase n=1 Tax=Ophiobolus disseminans TaxID=1469910 RepID=A0A6A7A2X9_9PLEO|nr:hypothetical protein CC86DRAFT_290712 [Ophiobolus disseminans]
MLTTTLSTLFTLVAITTAHDEPESTVGAYALTADLTYDTFFEGFEFFNEKDPTDGYVQYQDLKSAIAKGLVGYLNDTQSVFMGVDYTTKDPKGRDAVRIRSKKAWNQGLAIADIQHMPPSQCGVWPAYWLLGSDAQGKENWPDEGEIDILEGVNDYENNAVTLHTNKGCTMDNTTQMVSGASTSLPYTGSLFTSDCDVKNPDQPKNAGCSIKAPKTLPGAQMGIADSTEQTVFPSYGTAFNTAGGGIYATEWTSTYISVWFIPRDSPLYALASSASPDPTQWGMPVAHFAGKSCDYVKKFVNLKMIFNTTFCGQWAGDPKEWNKSCAKKTGVAKCEDYVRDNPEAFADSYWEVRGVKWYQKPAATKRGAGTEGFVKGKAGRWQRA